jgi:hypothetical protein
MCRPFNGETSASRIWLATLALLIAHGSSLHAAVEFAPCKNNFSPDQQIQLGDKAAQQVYKQMPVLPDSSPITQYISQLGHRLTAVAPGYKWPYNFHVANVAEINAFALPGGTVFVNLGTIQAAESEAQLAGVMAHEISHVVLQHSVCNAEKQQRVGLLAGIGQIAAGVLLGPGVGDVAAQGIGLTAGLGFLKMSRGAERQADLEGAKISYNAGFDPRGLPQFFEIIQGKYGAGGSQFMSDHPNPGNRTEYVDKEIATFPPRANSIKTSDAFERVKDQVIVMHAYTAKEVASGIWKRQNPNQLVSAGVNQPAGPQVGSVTPDLSASGEWKAIQTDSFSLQIPTNWKAYGSQTSALIGPPGGITRSAEGGAGNVVYGMLTDQYRPQPGIRGAAAVDALVHELGEDNPGFTPGTQRQITVNGVAVESIDCENPSANSGHGEHDWVVAFPQRDASLRYFVFVAPTPDFETWRPTFRRILEGIRVQD